MAALFLLGASACHTTHTEKKPAKETTAASITTRQTGSNLPRHIDGSDSEPKEKKSKRKTDKKTDDTYLPRDGFR